MYQGQLGFLHMDANEVAEMQSWKEFYVNSQRTVTSKILVISLSKIRKFTHIKIVILPGYFTVINSCGKALRS